jgi:hypothetical protein
MQFWFRHCRLIGRLVLVSLFLTQGIQVAQSCTFQSGGAAMAFEPGEPCHSAGQQDRMIPNACLSQCLQSDQADSTAHTAIPALVLQVALLLPIVGAGAERPATSHPKAAFVASGPPASIRFCSFLL